MATGGLYAKLGICEETLKTLGSFIVAEERSDETSPIPAEGMEDIRILMHTIKNVMSNRPNFVAFTLLKRMIQQKFCEVIP